MIAPAPLTRMHLRIRARLPGRPAHRLEERPPRSPGPCTSRSGTSRPARRPASASRFMSRYFFRRVDRPPRGRASAWPGRARPRRSAALRRSTSRSQGNRSACTKRDAHLVQVRVLLGQRDRLLVEIDADHLLGLAERLGVDREAAGVAAQVEHALAGAEARPGTGGCRAGRRRSRSCACCPARRGSARRAR